MSSLITPQQLKPILDDIGAQGVQLIQDQINNQKDIHDKPYTKLSESTIKAKERSKRGGVKGNADKRMKATNDFVDNAFQYRVDNNGITFFISPKVHKLQKIASERKSYRTNLAKGKNMKKPIRSYTNNKGVMVTYQDIALYNISGNFDYGWRKAGNPGADFFGFSKSNEEKLVKIFAGKVKPIIEANVVDAIKKICR